MERYILKSEYVDYDAHELAVHLANLLCEKHAADATILVPAKKHFKNVTLKKVFTEGAMRKLNAGKHVLLPCGQSIHVESRRTFHPSAETGVVLAMYVDEKDLSRVDECTDTKALVVVPWMPTEVEAWVNQWSPIEVDPSQLKQGKS